MGRDRQLPHALARMHRRYHTPCFGLIVTAAISLGVVVALALTVGICWLGSGLPSAALAQYLPNDGEQDKTSHTGEIIL
jgi:amino acid transporter